MFCEAWGWVIDMLKDGVDATKEYMAQWYQSKKNDPEFRAKRQEAVDRYRQRKAEEDPEGFKEYRREIQNRSSRNVYARKRAAMTEEELEEYRKKTRERIAKYRAKKKAEKLAAEAAAKAAEENKGTV